ncbi:hypothetical protein [Sphingomonas sp. 28-63-12]|uniref:hypothetical protein n=1 Tax=Sphingomonas sp. 28-63-12 TaxID=1970434 RepID=UPI0035A98683
MQTSKDRQYLRQRALQERDMSTRAACVEAAVAHDMLEHYYVEACAMCEHGRTQECTDCEMQARCEIATQ